MTVAQLVAFLHGGVDAGRDELRPLVTSLERFSAGTLVQDPPATWEEALARPVCRMAEVAPNDYQVILEAE